jgi:putative PIN family toxin of toxin-antitoxin system
MKVLLDSNVIIAAFATRGLCNELFEICVENHTILLSDALLKEIRKNLVKKIKVPSAVASEIIAYLRSIAIVKPVPTKTLDPKVCRDPNELEVLELAVQEKVDCIISGDEDLLVLNPFQGIPIYSPRAFWEHLSSR